jgi:hypothetical protein
MRNKPYKDTGLRIYRKIGTLPIGEFEAPIMSHKSLEKFSSDQIQKRKADGLGGYKFGMTDYRGFEAFSESFPQQRIIHGNSRVDYPAYTGLAFVLDSTTRVLIESFNTDEPIRQELLSSLNITRSEIKTPGSEDRNLLV